MNIAHPKTDIRRTFLAKLSFEFMAVIVTIELGFRQQVVAEALKYLLKVSVRSKSRDGSLAVSLFYPEFSRYRQSGQRENDNIYDWQIVNVGGVSCAGRSCG